MYFHIISPLWLKSLQKKKALTFRSQETLASGTLGLFIYICAGVGFELPLFGDVSPRFVRFFAVSFPFFFVRENSLREQDLVGDEIHEQKTRNQRVRVEIFAGDEMPDPSTREVPTMRMQTFMEKWTPRGTFWNVATLLLQRMRITLYKVVKTSLFFLFCFSKLYMEDQF